MKRFSALLERLYYEPSNLGKERLLMDYFRTVPDPDRGYALAIIADTLNLPNFKRGMVLDLIRSRTDPTLLQMSYDYVGELSETVAHLWPGVPEETQLPLLHQLVERLLHTPKAALPEYVASLLDGMTSPERWALLKIGSGNLRVGVSERFIKQVLAKMGDKPIEAVESVWHGVELPYTSFFEWIEGKLEMPLLSERITFTPVMLAHPLEEKNFPAISAETYAAEWKYDGIRVQLVSNERGKALFTRTGDDISHAFPEVLDRLHFHATLDGELLVKHPDGTLGTFNDLQQRLGRKAPTPKLIATYPTAVVAYDILSLEHEDMRSLPYTERRRLLGMVLQEKKPERMELSAELPFAGMEDLKAYRESVSSDKTIEGLMLKRRDSPYVAGRPTGPWFKWKNEPRLVDAVLMYAQRGSGKRSSYYSDYTFGLWQDDHLLPIGKAYFGFTDEELKQIDKWVRHHIIQNFGPVSEVDKELVFEVAFDAVHRSKRHKSGFALRFPRINRIRWDKPAKEADHLKVLETLVTAQE